MHPRIFWTLCSASVLELRVCEQVCIAQRLLIGTARFVTCLQLRMSDTKAVPANYARKHITRPRKIKKQLAIS